MPAPLKARAKEDKRLRRELREGRDEIDKAKKQIARATNDLKEGEEISGLIATNASDADCQRLVRDLTGAAPPAPTDSSGAKDASAKKTAGSVTSINPYADNPRGDDNDGVVDLSNALILDKVVLCKFRFDENYIFCIERVELDPNEFNIKNYVAWAIKRCRVGENDEDLVPDKTGKLQKRFAFSGKLASLPELHEAVYNLCLDSSIDTLISWDKAKQLEKDKFGVIDISTPSRPSYSPKVYAFGPHRAYMDDVTYNNAVNQAVVYKALALTKWRNEKSKSKSKSDLDFFLLHIPARRMWHFLLAIELAMDLNNIKPKVPFTGGVIRREIEVEELDEEEEEADTDGEETPDEESAVDDHRRRARSKASTKKRKKGELISDDDDEVHVGSGRKKRKAAKSASYVDISDTDSDYIPDDRSGSPMLDEDGEEDEPTPSVGEEEREADDRPTVSDEEFIDDSEMSSKRVKDKKKKKKISLDNFDEVESMYRKLLARKTARK